MNIFVANVQFSLSEDDLRGIFEEYGVVNSVKLIIDKQTGKSKGFRYKNFVKNALK